MGPRRLLQALAEQSRIVRLPLNRVGALNKIGKAFSTLEQEFEHGYYDEEDVEPQVLVLATGELSPFSVLFERGFDATRGFSVSGSLTGHLEVARLGDNAR